MQEHKERINPRHNVWTSDGSGTQNMGFGSDMEKMEVSNIADELKHFFIIFWNIWRFFNDTKYLCNYSNNPISGIPFYSICHYVLQMQGVKDLYVLSSFRWILYQNRI